MERLSSSDGQIHKYRYYYLRFIAVIITIIITSVIIITIIISIVYEANFLTPHLHAKHASWTHQHGGHTGCREDPLSTRAGDKA